MHKCAFDSGRRPWADQATLRSSAKGCEAAQNRPSWLYLVHRGGWFRCRFAALRGQVRSYENRDIADKRSVAWSAPTPYGQQPERNVPGLFRTYV
ncbi:hypothetical protein B0B36_20325 [Pseudomonas syringae pv. actinidifoliorum]|nr:hypothetical protein B0B36_20325 [Pseudomonas syringae pv. actinidifoliorum]